MTTNSLIAIPLDVGSVARSFEDTNQFEIFLVDSQNKITKQSTVTIPLTEKPNTLGAWLHSLNVGTVLVSKGDKQALSLLKEYKIEVIKVSDEHPEQAILEYVQSKQQASV